MRRYEHAERSDGLRQDVNQENIDRTQNVATGDNRNNTDVIIASTCSVT